MTLYYKTRGERRADGGERWYAYARHSFLWLGFWRSLKTWPTILGERAEPIADTKEAAHMVCLRHAAERIDQERRANASRIVARIDGEVIAVDEGVMP